MKLEAQIYKSDDGSPLTKYVLGNSILFAMIEMHGDVGAHFAIVEGGPISKDFIQRTMTF